MFNPYAAYHHATDPKVPQPPNPLIREIRVIRDNPRFAAYSPKCDVHSDNLPQNRINLHHNRKRLRHSHQNRTIPPHVFMTQHFSASDPSTTSHRPDTHQSHTPHTATGTSVKYWVALIQTLPSAYRNFDTTPSPSPSNRCDTGTCTSLKRCQSIKRCPNVASVRNWSIPSGNGIRGKSYFRKIIIRSR